MDIKRDGVSLAGGLSAGSGDNDGGGIDDKESSFASDAVYFLEGLKKEVQILFIAGVDTIVFSIVIGRGSESQMDRFIVNLFQNG